MLVDPKADGKQETRTFSVNDPLRLPGANVNLLGHGYAPILRYTDRYGAQQTKVVPFLPRDGMFTSEGVATFPDVNIDPKTDKRDENLQVGFEGVYLPTVSADGSPASAYPAERDPVLFLTAYRGNLGRGRRACPARCTRWTAARSTAASSRRSATPGRTS